MKKTITLFLVSLFAITIVFSEMVPVSYTTQCGAFIEELVPSNHWRVTLSEEDRAPEFTDAVASYEREVFVNVARDEFCVGIDVLAFVRNERLRKQRNERRGYLVQVGNDEEVVVGQPEGEEPNFLTRQLNTVAEAWEENPWKVIAIGTGVFLVADYFIFDSGELNAWGLLSSSSGSSQPAEGSSEANTRTSESSNTLIVSGDNNTVNFTSSTDRSTDESRRENPPQN